MIFAVAAAAGNTFGTPSPGGWNTTLSVTGLSRQQSVWYRVEPAHVQVVPSVTETSHQWDAALVAMRLAP